MFVLSFFIIHNPTLWFFLCWSLIDSLQFLISCAFEINENEFHHETLHSKFALNSSSQVFDFLILNNWVKLFFFSLRFSSHIMAACNHQKINNGFVSNVHLSTMFRKQLYLVIWLFILCFCLTVKLNCWESIKSWKLFTTFWHSIMHVSNSYIDVLTWFLVYFM